MRHSGYQRTTFDPERLKETGERVAGYINALSGDEKPDAIAVSGASGLALGGIVSAATGVPLILVRKPREDHHSHGTVNGPLWDESRAGRYVVLDDFVSSGDTVRRIVSAVKKELPNFRPTAVLAYLSTANGMTVHSGRGAESSTLPIVPLKWDDED